MSEHTQPDPYPYPNVHRQPAPPRKRRVWPWLLLAIAVGLCAIGGIAISANVGPPSGSIRGTVAPADPATEAAPAKPAEGKAPAKPQITGGTWEVPGEVKPGTYTTTADGHCYWARLKSFDGELESIVANGNLNPGDRGRITVKKSDKGLELTGDCTWKAAK